MSENLMSRLSLMETIYSLAVAADKATDIVVHEKVAKIVKLHAKIAVGSAWIPIPGADLAASAANAWTMYVRINKTLNIPFTHNGIKSIATGIGTNLLSSLPMLGISSALKWIPGIGTFTGSLIMSGSLYTVTIAAGIVYMKALAALLKKKSKLTQVNLKGAVDSIFKDKSAMNLIRTAAAREYETANASGELNG